MLASQHFFFGAAGAAAFLAAYFFAGLEFGRLLSEDLSFYFLNKPTTSQETVHGLGSVFLAFHQESGRPMEKLHAAGGLVYVLTTGAPGTDKTLVDILLTNA